MAAAAGSPTSAYPSPFDTEEGIKAIPSILHPYLHRQPVISNLIQSFLTEVDAILYSSSFRTFLQSLHTDRVVQTYLETSEQTRQHVYRFYVKGSNDYILIEQYLKMKHNILLAESLPHTFESDWDMSILINPSIANDTWQILFAAIQNICLEQLMKISHILPTLPEYSINILSGIDTAKQFINEIDRYATFKGWKITFKPNVQKPLTVYDKDRGKTIDKDIVERLGLSGKGTIVRSNYTPFEGAQFYLARLMANVVAGNGIPLPVEIIDIAIPYKGDELELSWESHTEMHFVYNGFDYRILSPVGLYVDLAKTIWNAEKSGNIRRTRKLAKRLRRVQHLLDDIIHPYMSHDNTMRSNITRLSTSRTATGSAVRTLTRRLENRRPIQKASNLFEDLEDE
jgi:hypothetical protein